MNEEEQSSREEKQSTEEKENASNENANEEKNSDNRSEGKDENDPSEGNENSSDEDDEENSDEDDENGNSNDEENSDNENESSEESKDYDPDLMLESRNRKLLYDKFIALRDILSDISNLADDLLSKYENSTSSDPALFTSWKNASYISNTAQEKIEQISSILRSDAITKLEIDKLRKIFLALQRITNSLIDLLERANRKIK